MDVLVRENRFQEEETYTFSSLINTLKAETKRQTSTTTKCLLAVLWKIYGNQELQRQLLFEIEQDIEAYDSDPARETNRIAKAFVCLVYGAITETSKHDAKIMAYGQYVRDSGNWLGQPRIASCIALLENHPLNDQAKRYLKEEFAGWISKNRDNFVAYALLGTKDSITEGDLQRTIEYVIPKIQTLPVNLLALYLTAISLTHIKSSNKEVVQDHLYSAIRKQVGLLSEPEDIISVSIALFVAKYHKISGYFEKNAQELRDIIELNQDLVIEKKIVISRYRALCVCMILSVVLFVILAFVPDLFAVKESKNLFGQILLYLAQKKWWIFSTGSFLSLSILYSYLNTGDPVPVR